MNEDITIPEYVMSDIGRMIIRIGANQRWYDQKWLGVPIWQLPVDLMRLQEIVFEVQPQWIIETGTKFGGSALFFSTLLKLNGRHDGGVITIDIEKRPETSVLDTHPMADLVRHRIIGDASSEDVRDKVASCIGTDIKGPVMVFLDDDHNAEHVYRELQHFAPLVSPGSYLIVADTVFADLAGSPVGTPTAKYPDMATSNPRVAVARFLAQDSRFERDPRYLGKGFGNFDDGFLKKLRTLEPR